MPRPTTFHSFAGTVAVGRKLRGYAIGGNSGGEASRFVFLGFDLALLGLLTGSQGGSPEREFARRPGGVLTMACKHG
jgi:hypothetical protein